MNVRILMACAVLLSACASGGSGKEADRKTAAAAVASSTEALPSQTLAPGDCGLFLWTRDEPRRFMLFYPAGAGTAKAIVNGRQTELSVESQGGDVFEQFMTQMGFQSADGIPVSLSLQPGELIQGGRRVPSAQMISQDREGWQIITPLAGLTACQPE